MDKERNKLRWAACNQHWGSGLELLAAAFAVIGILAVSSGAIGGLFLILGAAALAVVSRTTVWIWSGRKSPDDLREYVRRKTGKNWEGGASLH